MKNSNSNKFRSIDQLKDTYFVHIDYLERLQKRGNQISKVERGMKLNRLIFLA